MKTRTKVFLALILFWAIRYAVIILKSTTFEGIVTDKETGAPISGASVHLTVSFLTFGRSKGFYEAITDANGHYTLEGVKMYAPAWFGIPLPFTNEGDIEYCIEKEGYKNMKNRSIGSNHIVIPQKVAIETNRNSATKERPCVNQYGIVFN